MIVASLAVIIVLIGSLFEYLQRVQTAEVRSRGVDLARLLASIPFEQLVPATASQGGLHLLKVNQENTNFAYAILAGTDGEILAEVTASGFAISESLQVDELSNWPGERMFSSSDYGRDLLEFYAPMLGADDRLVNIRLGFFRPAFGPTLQQLPFFAILALVVFMLTPLFYFMLKREIRPLRDANREISSFMNDGAPGSGQLEQNSELSDIMKRFGQFSKLARERIAALEKENSALETSQKFQEYRNVRVQTALHSLPDAVLILNESGKATFANRKVEALFGVAESEIIGNSATAWCADPDVQSFLAQYDSKETGTTFDETTVLFEPSLAPEKKLSMAAFPLFSPKEGEEIVGTLVVFHDVSEEAVAEENRASFVAQLAHELKTPLNTLNLYSEVLLGPDGREESMRVEASNVIHDEVERLATLVGNMLNISKVEAGTLSLDRHRTRLRDLVEDVFNHLSKSGRAGKLDFELSLPRELSAVSVDKDLLRIALNNLLSNAIKYSEPGGKVTLSATENDDFIEMRVTDTGLGIGLEDQERIFEKFYRSEDEQAHSRGGHGLGLPLAKQIIELHRGKLTVKSAPGEGSEFTIHLKKEAGLVQQAI